MTESVLLVTPDVPPAARRRIAALKGVRVDEAAAGALVSEDGVQPLRIIHLDTNLLADLARRPGEATLAIIRGVIDFEAAARLEDNGIAYVDASGQAWVPGAPRSSAVRKSSSPRRGLGFAKTRAAQVLVDHPREGWSEALLGERAGVSPRTARSLLEQLERDGVLLRSGRTRATVRTLDAGRMRQWLITHARPGRVSSVGCFLPGDGPLPPEAIGVPLALTGAAAAALIGYPVLLGAPRRLVRAGIDPEGLEDLPAALGGFRTRRGANTTLIADPHLLAFTDDKVIQGNRLAPASRIALDLFLEPRGESAVGVFLDMWPSA